MADRPDLAVVVIGYRAPAEVIEARFFSLLADQYRRGCRYGGYLQRTAGRQPLRRGYRPLHVDDGGPWMADVSTNLKDRQADTILMRRHSER